MKTIRNIFILVICCIAAFALCFCGVGLFLYSTGTFDDYWSLIADGSLIKKSDLAGLEDSKITGEELEFDEDFYPYYGLLNTKQKRLYKQIYANMDAVETTFIPVVEINKEDVSSVVEAVFFDHPEIFWANYGYSYRYLENDVCVQIILSYNELADNLEYYKSEFEKEADKIVTQANLLSTDYQKEKYVHDTIIEMVEYDTVSEMNQFAYSALVTKKSVCAGYVRAFQYIMIELGIPTYFVSGIAEENHAWNIVKLEDGYYNVDLTWDDQGSVIYNFFNLADSEFNETHTREGMALLLPECSGSVYSGLENTNTFFRGTFSIPEEEQVVEEGTEIINEIETPNIVVDDATVSEDGAINRTNYKEIDSISR